jgi:hypothetical protein
MEYHGLPNFQINKNDFYIKLMWNCFDMFFLVEQNEKN